MYYTYSHNTTIFSISNIQLQWVQLHVSAVCIGHHQVVLRLVEQLYRGTDKFLARPWKETSYSDQDLQQYTKAYCVQTIGIYKQQEYIPVVCTQ